MRKMMNLYSAAAALFASQMSHGMSQRPPAPRKPAKKKVMVMPEPRKAKVHYVHPDPRQAALNKLTNWQRNQVMRAYKGRLDDIPLQIMQDTAKLPHWKAVSKGATE